MVPSIFLVSTDFSNNLKFSNSYSIVCLVGVMAVGKVWQCSVICLLTPYRELSLSLMSIDRTVNWLFLAR